MRTGKNPEPRVHLKEIKAFNYPIEEIISLPKPKATPDRSFFDILNARRSVRDFSKLRLNKIGDLLWYSSKVKTVSVSKNLQILSHRPSPSAGAIHPIDIFISLHAPLVQRTLYYYNPFTHKIARLKLHKYKLTQFFRNVDDCLKLENATLVWFAADGFRTKSKYKNAESLIWKDAGALLMTLQLVAAALNINSCPIGTLGEPYFSKLFYPKSSIFSVGGIVIG